MAAVDLNEAKNFCSKWTLFREIRTESQLLKSQEVDPALIKEQNECVNNWKSKLDETFDKSEVTEGIDKTYLYKMLSRFRLV